MELGKYIKEMLMEKDNILVPNLGTFEKIIIPASINKQTGDMKPPGLSVAFSDKNKTGNNVLCDSIAEKLKIAQSEATKKVKEQVDSWNTDIKSGKKVSIQGLGYLQKNKENKIVFNANITTSDLPEFYGLPTISVSTKEKIVQQPQNDKAKTTTKPKPKEKEKPQKQKQRPQKQRPQTVKKKKEPVVKTDKEKKKDRRRLILLLLLIPLLVLIGLAIWKFDYVKQQSNSMIEYFNGSPNNQDSLDASKDTLQTSKVTPQKVKQDSLENVKKQENKKTEKILENYTIIDSKTNNQVTPRVEEFKSAKKIHIIAGSFSNKRNANKEKRKLLRKGFKNAKVLPLSNNLYRISIESFNKVGDAVKDFDRIKSIDNSLDIWVLIDK